ncbi:MAG: GNAT family N-acetyltransferase [Mitsuaria chitosanitabida]|uniref:GNAT family N-acetyltransferase n=1 Tax=Roseateles chitosanitabidus TaxID=65048 RepID=UPI001B0E0037|nr:GNAT family protein [Roseateles chitosanitabidus]MBO9689040.1 GNAT family N-acetyltransferase [Roseateles chitosanitabidus]
MRAKSTADDPLLIDVPERLETPRLLLLAPRAGMGVALNRTVLEARESLKPWMPWAHETPSVEQSEAIARRMQAQFLQREHLAYYLHEREPDGRAGALIGGAGLHTLDWQVRRYEIGYWLTPTRAGRGLVTEAVAALVRLGFGPLRARRMEIRTDARNAASRAVAERCGFTLEGVLRRDALDVQGEPCDSCVYAMTSLDELTGR